MFPPVEPYLARRDVLAMVAASPLLRISAADGGAVTVTRAFAHPPRIAPAEHFIGDAQVSSSFQAGEPAGFGGAIVTFMPGARTAWHIHPLGQTLVVVSGSGLVQRWGDPAHRIGPGDVVWIPPKVKHWHGAGLSGGMAHLAVSAALDGKTVDWAEQVSGAQYASDLVLELP